MATNGDVQDDREMLARMKGKNNKTRKLGN